MAIEIREIKTCDVDETDRPRKADGTYRLGIDGSEYELELCGRHKRELDMTLAPYIEHARKPAAANGQRRGQARTTVARRYTMAVRLWAKTDAGQEFLQRSGITLRDRGRIPEPLMVEYKRLREM
jgi:hypothetical protein